MKAVGVFCIVVSEFLSESRKHFDPFVDCFMAHFDSSPHSLLPYRICMMTVPTRSLASAISVDIIRLNLFAMIQFMLQPHLEDLQIVVIARQKGSIDPTNVRC